jgi:hypothetical protein
MRLQFVVLNPAGMVQDLQPNWDLPWMSIGAVRQSEAAATGFPD